MPYITEEDRKRYYLLNETFRVFVNEETTEGELNYLITCLVMTYLDTHEKNYKTMNAIRGAIENAASEFYRRVIAPYEDEKIKENGDVY